MAYDMLAGRDSKEKAEKIVNKLSEYGVDATRIEVVEDNLENGCHSDPCFHVIVTDRSQFTKAVSLVYGVYAGELQNG